MRGAVTISAQIFPGRITGTVTDSQGAVVAGATVKLSNPATGFERVAVTGENGDFNFAELALGTYQLTVSKENFKTAVLNGITTALGQVNTVDPVLTVGSASSEIEVTTAPALMQTETNSAGGQLSQQQVSSLPLGNSDYTRLALVLPGATQNSNFAFAQYTINGSRSRSNGFNIDGISNTDPSTYLPSLNEGGNSATAATRLPLDAIQEVSVVSAGPADTGQNSGSVMNAIVQSGTNQFHGTAYEMHRDAALDAANFFENAGGVPKAPFVWNEFGASGGGPIYIPHVYDGRNRTFFFVAYDGSRLKLGTTLNGSAPTPTDISQAEAALATQGIAPNQLGLNVLNLYSGLGLSGPFVVDNRGQQSPNSFISKLDHKISDKDSLSARFIYANGARRISGRRSRSARWIATQSVVWSYSDNRRQSWTQRSTHLLADRSQQFAPRLEPLQPVSKRSRCRRRSSHDWTQHRSRTGKLRHPRVRYRRLGAWTLFESGIAIWRWRPRRDDVPGSGRFQLHARRARAEIRV